MSRSSVAFVVLAILFGCSFPAQVRASPDLESDLRREIRQRYEGKLLLLNSPSSFDVIHIDGKGHPTRPPNGEPWTTSGLLQAKKISLQNRLMTIDGPRVIVVLDPASPASLQPVTTDRDLHLTIELPSWIRNSTDLNNFLRQLFSADDVRQRMANAWHAEVDLRSVLENPGALPGGRIGTLAGGRAVYAWESGVVTKPKALYKPGPSYPANALLKHVSGAIRVRVVVNEQGFPEILEIVQHLGEGLDVRALSAVSQWRFERPIRNGEGAATMVTVEIKFALRARKS